MINRAGGKVNPQAVGVSYSHDSITWSKEAQADNGDLVAGHGHAKPGPFAFQITNYVVKMMNIVSKMMGFVSGIVAVAPGVFISSQVSTISPVYRVSVSGCVPFSPI